MTKNKTIKVDMSDELFLKIAKLAHKKDITFNKMCNIILLEIIKKEKLKLKGLSSSG